MLIHNASQLITLAGGPQRGSALGRLGVITDGAVVVRGNTIEAVGASADLLRQFPQEERWDAAGSAALPALVDPHTHLVFAGDRAAEAEMRFQGKSYAEIQAAGGGILSTTRATRAASVEELVAQARPRAREMFRHGTGTAEAKTGYGLELESELRMLEAILRLDDEGPLQLAPTFMPAHAFPPEFTGREEAYVEEICQHMLPAAKDWWLKHASGRSLPFVDVFCETGNYSLAQTRRIFEAAKALGFPLKVHADEFDALGGALLAAEMGAASADHLLVTPAADMEILAQSGTAAVALPCTPFGLGQKQYMDARALLAFGGLLALATDFNPGTAWCPSQQFSMALACRTMRLSPAEALAAATINAAAAIGLERLIGSIEPGKQADLLILNVADYRHLAYRFGGNLARAVMKKGQLRCFDEGPSPC